MSFLAEWLADRIWCNRNCRWTKICNLFCMQFKYRIDCGKLKRFKIYIVSNDLISFRDGCWSWWIGEKTIARSTRKKRNEILTMGCKLPIHHCQISIDLISCIASQYASQFRLIDKNLLNFTMALACNRCRMPNVIWDGIGMTITIERDKWETKSTAKNWMQTDWKKSHLQVFALNE